MLFYLRSRQHEIIFRTGFDYHMLAFGKMNIVVIIPAWHRVDHFIFLINDSTVQRINERPATGSN